MGLLVVAVAVLTAAVGPYMVPLDPLIPRSPAEIKYAVFEAIGDPLVCTGFGIPNPPFTPNAAYPKIVGDMPTYLAILRHRSLPPTPLSSAQVIAVYRDWLKLNAVRLEWHGPDYTFKMPPRANDPEGLRRFAMPTYVCLMKFTSDGIRGIKDHPKRRDEARTAAEGMGLKIHGVYLTLGPYDLTVLLDAPNDEAAAQFALGSSMRGKISTLTMRAFTESEADQLIGGLP